MSRAFVKEPDGAEAEELPDRPISEHPNLVTPQGLAQIEETLTRLHEQHAQAPAGRPRGAGERGARPALLDRAALDAQPMPAPEDAERYFGSTVTIARRRPAPDLPHRRRGRGGAPQGTLSYVSPVAARR